MTPRRGETREWVAIGLTAVAIVAGILVIVLLHRYLAAP